MKSEGEITVGVILIKTAILQILFDIYFIAYKGIVQRPVFEWMKTSDYWLTTIKVTLVYLLIHFLLAIILNIGIIRRTRIREGLGNIGKPLGIMYEGMWRDVMVLSIIQVLGAGIFYFITFPFYIIEAYILLSLIAMIPVGIYGILKRYEIIW